MVRFYHNNLDLVNNSYFVYNGIKLYLNVEHNSKTPSEDSNTRTPNTKFNQQILIL